MKYIIFTLIAFSFLLLLAIASIKHFDYQQDLTENKMECLELRKQANQYPIRMFYITKKQDEMCLEIGLPVVANVVE